MGATLTLDPMKYARLANRVVVKAIETEEEYDRTLPPYRMVPHAWAGCRGPEWQAIHQQGAGKAARLTPQGHRGSLHLTRPGLSI